MATDRRERGLDLLNFFVANLQTAFGPFIAVYLTSEHWTEGQIGVALSIGTASAMVSQVPAGLLVDAMRSKRLAAFASIVAIIVSCLILAAMPEQLPVALAEVLHGFASCMLNPAIGAITLAIAGGAAGGLGVRFGRNFRYASIGNGIAAGLMAGAGYLVSARSVFFLASFLAAPGLFALRWLKVDGQRGAPAPTGAATSDPETGGAVAVAPVMAAPAIARVTPHGPVRDLFREPNLYGFAACAVFYYLANAEMLPLAASEVTRVAGSAGELVIGACVVLPQIVTALLSPTLGRAAERIGRRPVLLIGFAALPIRGLLFAVTTNPWLIIPVQMLDGVSSAVMGIMLPLIAADISRRTGRFNLALGVLGLAIGAGATLSTTLGGYTAELSERLAFLSLAGAGFVSLVLVWLLVREPRKDVASAEP